MIASLRAGLVIALSGAMPLAAQVPGVPAPPPPVADSTTPPLPRVDGLRLREGVLTYKATLVTGDTLRDAGTRTVSVMPTLYAGGTAWSIAESVSGVAGETRDSSVVAREDLSPLHWDGVRGPARIAAEIGRDTLYAAASWPTGRRSIVSALGGPVITSAAVLEAVVAQLPLQPGFRASARLLVVDLGGARVLPVTLAVEGMESVEVPAGRFDCWVVTLYGDRIEDRLWVRRDAPVVVRRTQRIPSRPGAMLEQVLLGDARR